MTPSGTTARNWTQRRWDLGYDALGELTSLNSTLTASNTVEEGRTWQYDTAGNMISNTSAPQGQNARLELRQHTGRNQLVGVGGTGSTVVEGLVDKPATVQVNGQPATVVSQGANGPWRFQKQMDFPLGSTTLTIAATDGNGNVGQQSYTVTVGNDETRALDYDSNGNLLHKVWLHSGAAYRRETYAWDAENRLLGWENRQLAADGQPETVLGSATWVYDGWGRRVKEHTVTGSTVQDKNIVWEGLTMVQWQNADGTAQKNLFGQGEQTLASGETLIYITDHLGSVRGWQRLSDGARGEADYSAYGTRTITSNATGVPVRSFTGHYQHEASGLFLAPYRAYDPDLGRWLSEDPIEEAGGLNLYGYVGNGPTSYVDTDGLWPTQRLGPIGTGNVHAFSIYRVLDSLPVADLRILANEQVRADRDQTCAHAYRHAMRGPLESVDNARRRANTWVKHYLVAAINMEAAGNHVEAMRALGTAIHTLQDNTSPVHEGFQIWGGTVYSGAGAVHVRGENFDPGPGSTLDLSTQAAYDFFRGTGPLPQF